MYKKISSILSALLCVHMLGAFCFAMESTPSHIVKSLPSIITLYPKDADLRYAPNVIVEPRTAPYNLGGWRSNNVIVFPVEIEEAGEYSINILYSKQALDGSTGKLGIFATLSMEKNSFIHDSIFVELPTTGNNWSTYAEKTLGDIKLPQGKVFLAFWDQEEIAKQYVMNLRELRLQKK